MDRPRWGVLAPLAAVLACGAYAACVYLAPKPDPSAAPATLSGIEALLNKLGISGHPSTGPKQTSTVPLSTSPAPSPSASNFKTVPSKRLVGFAEVRKVVINTPTLKEGEPLRITVHVKKDGEGPLHKFFLSPNIMIVEYDKMPITEKDDKDSDAFAQTTLRDFSRKVRTYKNTADSIGKEEDIFQTATSRRLTQSYVDGFLTGRTRIYLLTVVIWKDVNETPGLIESCLWLQAMPSLDVGLQNAAWHPCGKESSP